MWDSGRSGVNKVPPRKRAVGGTLEFTFKLPKAANHGNTQPRKPRAKAHPKPAEAKIRNTPKVREEKRTYQDGRNYASARAAKIRADTLAKGLCLNRRQPAIAGQTRCPTCAEKHRQGDRRRRESSTPGRNNAKIS